MSAHLANVGMQVHLARVCWCYSGGLHPQECDSARRPVAVCADACAASIVSGGRPAERSASSRPEGNRYGRRGEGALDGGAGRSASLLGLRGAESGARLAGGGIYCPRSKLGEQLRVDQRRVL
jgi:hypothetical protein